MLTVSRLASSAHPDFEAAIEIYLHAFPANERHAIAVIAERLDRGVYDFFVGKTGEQVMAMAIFYPLPGSSFILLDYLAVQAQFRGGGTGAAFLSLLVSTHYADRSLILEVENPQFGDNKAEREQRIRFYRKAGAKVLNDVRYILPPLSGTEPTEMVLMLMAKELPACIAGRQVQALMRQIYRELYNRDEEDELLRKFIDRVGEWVEVK